MILWSWGISCIPRPLHPSGKGDHDLGHTDRVRHRIDMVDETSFKHRYRRIPPSMYDEVRSHLKQLLDNAVIRPSHSPFASAIVKFKDYLYQEDFTVCTDNNPVTYVLTSAKLDATGHCWLASLAAFHFDIRYRQGRNNADADAPSRLPGTITSESVQPICNVITQEPYVDSLTIDSWGDIGESRPHRQWYWQLSRMEESTVLGYRYMPYFGICEGEIQAIQERIRTQSTDETV